MGKLYDAMSDAIRGRAPRGLPQAQSRWGWSTKEVAQRFGVTQRTAQRWQAAGQVPARRAGQLQDILSTEADKRARERAAKRGFGPVTIGGTYQVSNYRPQRTGPGSRFRTDEIPPAKVREILALADAGDVAAAEDVLSQAIADGYGITQPVTWEDVDSATFDAR